MPDSDGNWSYVQPVAAGAVTMTMSSPATYDDVTFRVYQRSALRVDAVLGEFYWQVKKGETVLGADYIAPPAMLSRENAGTEISWSLSTYMTPHEVEQAFAPVAVGTPPVSDIAGNTPVAFGGAHRYLARGARRTDRGRDRDGRGGEHADRAEHHGDRSRPACHRPPTAAARRPTAITSRSPIRSRWSRART